MSGLNSLAEQDLLNFYMNQQILERLGPQVDGGISGWIKKLNFDRALNVLNTVLLLHNAAMLSHNLIDSISFFLDNALKIFNITDENSQPIDLNKMLGNTVQSTLETILGEQTVKGLSEDWKKLSSIYVASTRMVNAIRNIQEGIINGLEVVGEYNSKIGNAMKQAQLVASNAYDWMDEKINFRSGKLGAFQRVVDGIEKAEDITSDLTEITESVIEVEESVKDFKENKEEFEELKEKAVKEKAKKEEKIKTNSKAPETITRDSLLEASSDGNP